MNKEAVLFILDNANDGDLIEIHLSNGLHTFFKHDIQYDMYNNEALVIESKSTTGKYLVNVNSIESITSSIVI